MARLTVGGVAMRAAIVAAAFALGAGGCTTEPQAARRAIVPLRIATPAYVRRLLVDVQGPGIDSVLAFELPIAGGAAFDTLELPAGSSRRFTASGFDSLGVKTHAADTTLTLLEDANPRVELALQVLTVSLPVRVAVAGYVRGVVVEVRGPGIDSALSFGISASSRRRVYGREEHDNH